MPKEEIKKSVWQKELDHWKDFLESMELDLDGDHAYKEQIEMIRNEIQNENDQNAETENVGGASLDSQRSEETQKEISSSL